MKFTHCAACKKELLRRPGRGKAEKYCSKECRKSEAKIRNERRELDSCCIAGCNRLATRISSKMCEAHYMRFRRTGTANLKPLKERASHSHGYVLIRMQGHPLQRGRSMIYEHRYVYYEAHGSGPFQCHWCSKSVTWDDLHIDHLNEIKSDNAIGNLVPSCPTCNQARGRSKILQWHRDRTGIEFNGERRSLNEWAAMMGISRSSIVSRLRNGWPVDRALTQPRGKFGPKTG